jgi:hypothetical protein
MNSLRTCSVALFAAAALTATASADLLYFHGNMDGSQGPNPNNSPHTGYISWLMDTNADTILYTADSTIPVLSNAHIHGPANSNQTGPAMHSMPFPLPATFTFFYDSGDEAFIIAGNTYTNLHTNAFPAGEVRSQNLLTARVYCSGDGSAAACPCANTGPEGEGCLHTGGVGAKVAPFGSTSVALDDMSFRGSQLKPNAPALLFTGINAAGGGNGVPFGGGLLCVGGAIKRLGVRFADAAGNANWDGPLSTIGAWGAGDRRFFQVWYRDAQNTPCGGGFNFSNALDITFN